jgi:hypothetical protein
MRGHGRALGFAALRIAARPPHPRSATSPRTRGEVAEKRCRSRGADASEFCVATKRTNLLPPEKGGGAPKGAPSIGRARANKCTQFAPLICLRGSGSCGSRSPSGASQRRLPERANAPAQPRPRFTRSRGCRRYPHHQSRLSKAPCAPVVMPAGHSSLGANCVHCL